MISKSTNNIEPDQGINLVIYLVSHLSGVRLVSCHSAVQLLLLLSNATVSIFVLLY